MDPLYFTVDSALLQELGEKLVETVHLALAELVKNAYDADATEVTISFEYNDAGEQIIKVIDNGIGMNHNAVRDYWMRIATTNKVSKDVSILYGRPLTGAKGIGRFCCRRLGSHLRLVTYGTKSGKHTGRQTVVEKTTVDFPWTTFTPGLDVTDIRCEGEQVEEHNMSTGTTLIISDVSDEWGTRGMNWLKRQLAILASNRGAQRDGFEEDPGFNIKLSAPDFDEEVRDIREDFINAGWGTLTAYVNSKNQAVCKLDAMGIGKRDIISSMTFPLLRGTRLMIGIMVLQRSQMRDTGLISQSSLGRILPEWGGVQVKHRGARVFPYGDDDWLKIDYDRGLNKGNPNDELRAFALSLKDVEPGRALLSMLSMRGYVGSVEISDNAAGFEMKLSREGFIDSTAVQQLKSFVRYAIDWSTILRDYYLRQQTQYELLESKSVLEEVLQDKFDSSMVVAKAVNYINSEVQELTKDLPKQDRDIIQASMYKATDAIVKYNENNRSELLHLKLMASTSSLLLIFSHEVKSLLGVLENSKNSLINIARNLVGKDANTVSEIADKFVDLKERLEELLELTSLVGTDSRRYKPGNIALRPRVEKVEKVFDLIIKKYDISVDHESIPHNIVISKVLEAEVYAIMLNALSNSIKSVIAGGHQREIKIEAERDGQFNKIRIKDTGISLDPSRYEEVFIPFISDPDGQLYSELDKRINPEDRLIVGSGTGLGLGIINEIVKAHEGTIQFVHPGKPWNNELEICLP